MVGSRDKAKTFSLLEATIGDIVAAYRSRDLSVRQLVQLYLDRIEAYDKRGPSINSIITVRPEALDEARQLDEALPVSEPVGPMYGIPVILKDQIDVVGTPTTLGSVLFRSYRPLRDAFVGGHRLFSSRASHSSLRISPSH